MRADRRAGFIVLGDHAAFREAGQRTGTFDGGCEVVSTNIVEIDVDAFRGSATQRFHEPFEAACRLVVDDMVGAERFHELAFFRAAG